jgi:putative YhdH/YhfP family quinone oxidoreductase
MAALNEPFVAYVVEEKAGRFVGRVGELTADRLPEGDVTIEVSHSSLNYKDALAATGQNKIAASYPHVPGIDAAGVVVESRSRDFAEGDRVLVTGYDLGGLRFGGWSRYVRVPADWVVPLPAGLTPQEAMAIGTAGFTAAMSLAAIERNGGRPDRGPAIVTGATGGVGCLAVNLLAQGGYEVAAVTGKADARDFLRELGATRILAREEARLNDERPRPLLKGTWGAAVDTVGGSTLAYLLRSMTQGGAIAVCGLVGGTEFAGTVIPFLLRGVKMLGIDSAHHPMEARRELWRRLATDWKPRGLEKLTETIPLSGLPAAIERILKGGVRGRIVVEIEP